MNIVLGKENNLECWGEERVILGMLIMRPFVLDVVFKCKTKD
jgi:hypothetical protein